MRLFFSTIYGPDRHINSERVKRHWQASKKRHWKRKIWAPSRQCQNKAINPLKNLRQKGKVQQQAQAKKWSEKKSETTFHSLFKQICFNFHPARAGARYFMLNWLRKRRSDDFLRLVVILAFMTLPCLPLLLRPKKTEREFKIRFYASPEGQCC